MKHVSILALLVGLDRCWSELNMQVIPPAFPSQQAVFLLHPNDQQRLKEFTTYHILVLNYMFTTYHILLLNYNVSLLLNTTPSL